MHGTKNQERAVFLLRATQVTGEGRNDGPLSSHRASSDWHLRQPGWQSCSHRAPGSPGALRCSLLLVGELRLPVDGPSALGSETRHPAEKPVKPSIPHTTDTGILLLWGHPWGSHWGPPETTLGEPTRGGCLRRQQRQLAPRQGVRACWGARCCAGRMSVPLLGSASAEDCTGGGRGSCFDESPVVLAFSLKVAELIRGLIRVCN